MDAARATAKAVRTRPTPATAPTTATAAAVKVVMTGSEAVEVPVLRGEAVTGTMRFRHCFVCPCSTRVRTLFL